MREREPNPLLTMDGRGYVYLRKMKICRWVAERQVYEFQDHRRARHQPARLVEVKPRDLAAEIIRLTEELC